MGVSPARPPARPRSPARSFARAGAAVRWPARATEAAKKHAERAASPKRASGRARALLHRLASAPSVSRRRNRALPAPRDAPSGRAAARWRPCRPFRADQKAPNPTRKRRETLSCPKATPLLPPSWPSRMREAPASLRSPPAASHGTVDIPPSRRVPPSCAHRPQGWPTLRSGDVKQKLTIAPAHCAWRGSAPDHLPGGVSVADRFIPAPPSPLALSDAPVHVSRNKHFCKRCGGQPPGCMKAPRPHAAPRRALTSPRSDELCSSRAPTRAGGHRARGGPAVARCSGRCLLKLPPKVLTKHLRTRAPRTMNLAGPFFLRKAAGPAAPFCRATLATHAG